jgi:hypothetical protein
MLPKKRHYSVMIKRRILFFPILFSAIATFAQPSQEQRIADSVIGWWSKPPSSEDLKPSVYKGHTFTTAQKEKLNDIVRWMYKTFTPVASLGTWKRMIYGNDYSFAPHKYGVEFRVWDVDFSPEHLDEKGHFKPISEQYNAWWVGANTIPGSYDISDLNAPGRYLFTWVPDGYGEADRNKTKGDPRIHPNVYKYYTHLNEIQAVYLVPGNKPPFTPVTRGEYLDLANESFDRYLAAEKKKIETKWSGDTKGQEDAYAYIAKEFDKYRLAVQKWKAKYGTSLQEPAVVRDMQPTIRSFDMDPFEISQQARSTKNYYPVYRLTAEVMEKCNADFPQWLVFYFPYKSSEDGVKDFEMYKAMTERFNYDYAYNYFFAPEKVKGKEYTPLIPQPIENGRVAGSELNKPMPRISSDGSFRDDFSANAAGAKPSGWYFYNYGRPSLVASAPRQSGKWMVPGEREVSPTYLTKPLPADFTINYDVATDDFSSRTGGSIALKLSSVPVGPDGRPKTQDHSETITVFIRAGQTTEANGPNYSGEAKITVNTDPTVNQENGVEGLTAVYSLKEFNNQQNKVHVTLTNKGGQLTLLINGKPVIQPKDLKLAYGKPCSNCNLPAGTRIHALSFSNYTNDQANVKVYLSNVEIK